MKIDFSIGDRIEVTSDNYRGRTVGLTGTVQFLYKGSIAVNIDGKTNTRSSYGCFYYKNNQLKMLGGDTIMEGNYNIAHVKFLEGSNTENIYHYALYEGTEATIGDICVAKSAHHGFGLVRIVDILPKSNEAITREIVCKADFTAYNDRVAQRKRKAELMTEMKKRAAAAQEILIYKNLAASDPAMAELLSEYESLGGSI
jgi:hypothetical protein